MRPASAILTLPPKEPAGTEDGLGARVLRSSGSAALACGPLHVWSGGLASGAALLSPALPCSPRPPRAVLGGAGPGSARGSVSSGPPWLPPLLPVAGALLPERLLTQGRFTSCVYFNFNLLDVLPDYTRTVFL